MASLGSSKNIAHKIWESKVTINGREIYTVQHKIMLYRNGDEYYIVRSIQTFISNAHIWSTYIDLIKTKDTVDACTVYMEATKQRKFEEEIEECYQKA